MAAKTGPLGIRYSPWSVFFTVIVIAVSYELTAPSARQLVSALPKGILIAVLAVGGMTMLFAFLSDNTNWHQRALKIVSGVLFVGEIAIFGYAVYSYYPASATPTAQAGHTPSIPGLFHIYGGGTECGVVIDGQLLVKWQDKYDAALVCGLNDNAVDRMHQTAIAISEPYTIGPHQMTMTVSYGRGKLLESIKAIRTKMHLPDDAHISFPAAYNVILLPKNINAAEIASITSIGDVPNHGGLIVEAEAASGQVQ